LRRAQPAANPSRETLNGSPVAGLQAASRAARAVGLSLDGLASGFALRNSFAGPLVARLDPTRNLSLPASKHFLNGLLAYFPT